MGLIFDIINAFFRFLFYPFRQLHPAWGMIWISLVTGILMLIIFRFTSDQRGIKSAKAKVGAYILEMRLFNHDLGKMLSALGKTLIANVLYLRYMIVPLIFIIVPVLITLIQISYRYENRPLQPGEQAIVKAVMKSDFPIPENPVNLNVPGNVTVETPALRIASLREVDWRISGLHEGEYQLDFAVRGRHYEKSLSITHELAALSPRRTGSSFYASLLNHYESQLPDDSPFSSLQIIYPDRALVIFGFELHWIVWFFIFSVAFSFAFKNIFKVEL